MCVGEWVSEWCGVVVQTKTGIIMMDGPASGLETDTDKKIQCSSRVSHAMWKVAGAKRV